MADPAASSAPLTLRPYQDDAKCRVRDAMRQGKRRVVLVLPTGAGKTRLAASVVQDALARGSRVLWLAHRTELVEQACRTLDEFGLPCSALAAASSRAQDPACPVQVASIQTLVVRPDRPPADLIIWDEAHHAAEACESWSGLLDAYPRARLLGLTATPERGDGAGLAPLFDGLVVGATVRQLTADGHLVPAECVRPAAMLKPGQIAQHPLAAYQAHADGRQTLLFARTVEEAQGYREEFAAAGVRTECVVAATPAPDRAASIELYRRGVVRVLTCVYVLTEGTDLPTAAVCLLARGAGAAGIYLQMVGRVLRPAPGKASALIIDLRGVSHVHGLPDDERLYSLEGRGICLAQTRHCPVCSAVLDGGYPCSSCGYAGPNSGESVETRVMDVPLVRFARKRAEDQTARDETLRRWVGAALAKGHRPASVRYKWRAVYDEDLPMDRLLRVVQAVRRG